jgi:hypothetical protein
MKISGELTAQDVAKANEAIDAALKNNERISIYVEIDPTMRLTFEGVVKDFVEGFSRLGQLHLFYRAAVVTDKGWMAAIARIEGLVFSSINIRVFEPAEREQALSWASEHPEKYPSPQPSKPSIRIIETNNENVFAWEIDGRIGDKDIQLALEMIRPFIERDEKFNTIVRIENYEGFDLKAALNNDLFPMKYKSAAKIEKYAVIGTKPWMRNLLELVSGLFNAEIRVFDENEEKTAWDWVGASRVYSNHNTG